jgi:hypothetical protein
MKAISTFGTGICRGYDHWLAQKKSSYGQDRLASQEFTFACISEMGLYKGRQGAHHVGP